MMTSTVKESTQTTIAEHTIDLQVRGDNLQKLDPEAVKIHTEMLGHMLYMMRRLLHQKLPKEGGKNVGLLNYLHRLNRTVTLIAMKNQITASAPANQDIQIASAIDPSDSGFPIFIRDMKFLRSDKERAEDELRHLPRDKQLVDEALFLLFRGYFPSDTILQKLTREYYEKLLKLDLPEMLKIYGHQKIPPPFKETDMCYCTQSFERFDDHSNIPRYYTLYLKIPSRTYGGEEWQKEIRYAIPRGLSTVTNLELPYLAKALEHLEGVQLECIERFDIGPFYNRYTHNSGVIADLITADDDSILLFRKYSVVRTSEKERTGMVSWFRGVLSGDRHIGEFSPVIASPQYMLMPHRLIQKAYNLNLFVKNTKMYGMTSTGRFYD